MLEYKAQLMDRNKELNKQIKAEKQAALDKLKKIPATGTEDLQSSPVLEPSADK
jgi:hypothetical protein